MISDMIVLPIKQFFEDVSKNVERFSFNSLNKLKKDEDKYEQQVDHQIVTEFPEA